jgi:hypothetical protein
MFVTLFFDHRWLSIVPKQGVGRHRRPLVRIRLRRHLDIRHQFSICCRVNSSLLSFLDHSQLLHSVQSFVMSEEHPADAQSLSDSDMGSLLSRSGPTSSYANVLKRRASPSFESLEGDTSRKRLKEDVDDNSIDSGSNQNLLTTQHAFADDLAQELNCGCCSELCYHPVVVSPCQHFFCGR